MGVVEVGNAWKARSVELAEWAFQSLANRFDGWGQYSRIGVDGARSWTNKGELTRGMLSRHFAGELTLGLHVVSPDQLVRWVVWDFDLHGDYNEQVATRNLEQAQLVQRTLATLGANALVHDSNGRGGYHVWLFFDKPRFCWDVHAWGRDFGEKLELSNPEFYPKQARITEWGNFVRLPGRHHKHDHWSRFLSGDTWLEGEEAADWLLNVVPAEIDGIIPTLTEAPAPSVSQPTAKAGDTAVPDGLDRIGSVLSTDTGDDILKAVGVLRKLSPKRVDDYDQWLKTGMALHSIDAGPEMLALWDGWSRRSSKYTLGDCAAKWGTFREAFGTGLGLGTLIQWARDDEAPAGTPEDRSKLLKQLNERLSEKNRSICITRVLRHGLVDSTFNLEFDGARNVTIGDAGDLLLFSKVRKAIADGTNIILSGDLKKEWESIAQAVLDLAEIVDLGSEEDETRAWLDLAMHNAPPWECKDEAMLQHAQFDTMRIGFWWQGVLYIRADTFLTYIKLRLFNNLTSKDISRRLALIGYTPLRFQYRKNKCDVKLRVWVNQMGEQINASTDIDAREE